jgi:hypothetical protein
VGGWRARQSVDERLPVDQPALDAIIQQADKNAMWALLPGAQWDFEKEIERRLFLDALIGKMKMHGDIQAGKILEMICDGMDREEISALLHKRTNSLAQNLHRSIRRALRELGVA